MAPALHPVVASANLDDRIPGRTCMKLVYATLTTLAIAALVTAPAIAGGDKAKTTDTQQVPSAGSSTTAEPKTESSPTASTGAGTQTQGSVTTDSPSASPPSPGTTDTSLNPSKPADAPASSTDSKEKN
jgi:hypothetical protein